MLLLLTGLLLLNALLLLLMQMQRRLWVEVGMTWGRDVQVLVVAAVDFARLHSHHRRTGHVAVESVLKKNTACKILQQYLSLSAETLATEVM